MKVVLKKDWSDFKAGHTTEITPDGMVEFSSTVEDVDADSVYRGSSFYSLNLEAVKKHPDIFEIVVDKLPEMEELDFYAVPMRSREEIEEKLAAIYEDIKIFGELDKNKVVDKYLFSLENMAYILEWALNKTE